MVGIGGGREMHLKERLERNKSKEQERKRREGRKNKSDLGFVTLFYVTKEIHVQYFIWYNMSVCIT